MWDTDKLLQLFGHTQCLVILSSVKPPNCNAGPDKLVFKFAANGEYSVKRAYEAFTATNQLTDREQSRFWEFVWKKGHILPRIRLFL